MKLKPYAEILTMTKAAIDAAIAPLRAKQAKAQGEMEMMKIDESLVMLETKIHELCAQHPLNYDEVLKKLDEVAILERRKRQFARVINELFGTGDTQDAPAEEVVPVASK